MVELKAMLLAIVVLGIGFSPLAWWFKRVKSIVIYATILGVASLILLIVSLNS